MDKEQKEWLDTVYNAFDGECMFVEHTLQKYRNTTTKSGDHQGGVETCLDSHLKLYADIVRSHLDIGDRVLSVGAGGGIADRAYFIATRTPVVAIDLEKSTRAAELLYPCPGVKRFVVDLREGIPKCVAELGPYNKVLLTDVYEHLDRCTGMRTIQAISELMTDDGVLLVSVPIWPAGAVDGNAFHLRTFRSKADVLQEMQYVLNDKQKSVWARTGDHAKTWGNCEKDLLQSRRSSNCVKE